MGSLRAALCPVVLATLALACATGDDDPSTTTGTGGAEETYPLPLIIDPAGDMVTIGAERITPLEVRVGGVVPGITKVLLDSRVIGALTPATALGELTAETLTLNLRGAMLSGTHTLALLNPGEAAPLSSRMVTIVVAASQQLGFAATLGDPVASEVAGLTLDGRGDAALLGALLPGEAAAIFRRAGAGWSASPRALAIPGYVGLDEGRTPALSAAWIGAADDPAPALRVAWRIGQDGRAIGGVELPWEGASSATPLPLASVPAPLDGPLDGPFEWASYGRPRFVGGDALIVEMRALVDSEAAHPGDHRLVHVRWPAAAEPDPPRLLSASELADLDALGPALNLVDPAERALVLRHGGLRPGWLLRDEGGPPRLEIGEDGSRLGAPADAPIALAGVASSLGAQIYFATQADGHVSALGVDALHLGDGVAIPPSAPPPGSPLTGAPSLGVLAGVPFVALPYGDAELVQLAVVDGTTLRFRPLAGVHCDALAVVADDPAATTAAFACVADGELRLGSLSASSG